MKKEMKKRNLISLVASLLLLVLSSCSKSGGPTGGGSTGGTTGTCSWSCDIDGVRYSWSGTYPGTPGRQDLATFLQIGGGSASISLSRGNGLNNDQLIFTFEPNPTPGTYNFNSSNYSTTRGASVVLGGSKIYSSIGAGSDFNITIPSIPTKSFLSTGGTSGAGYFKGTFSGTLMAANLSHSINITNGQYEVMVLQND
jgi:hypothetical protein